MFSVLRDKLSKGITDISKSVIEKEVSEKDITPILNMLNLSLLEGDVALETADKICNDLKQQLVGKSFTRTTVEREVRKIFKEELLNILDISTINLDETLKSKKPFTILFLGFNGVGKTTNLAKIAHNLKDRNFSMVIAAADTYRAASIEQLGIHAKNLGIHMIKQTYGSDSAAVIFDARKYAQAKGVDVVLADSAGRSHSNSNLMDELRKIVRVNEPDMNLLVVDSLAGNDALEQARSFADAVGIDGIVLTKMDVNEKGGAALSICHATGKPILFIGMGQEYGDLRPFEPEEFVDKLLS